MSAFLRRYSGERVQPVMVSPFAKKVWGWKIVSSVDFARAPESFYVDEGEAQEACIEWAWQRLDVGELRSFLPDSQTGVTPHGDVWQKGVYLGDVGITQTAILNPEWLQWMVNSADGDKLRAMLDEHIRLACIGAYIGAPHIFYAEKHIRFSPVFYTLVEYIGVTPNTKTFGGDVNALISEMLIVAPASCWVK